MTTAALHGATRTAPCPSSPARPPADGIICFGGVDWWYHNRGHYDLRMMREAASDRPVLYVNSIGMRLPRPTEGRMFLRRVGRKLASLRRGLVRIDERFAVFTPLTLPGRRGRRGRGRRLARQVRRAARKLGITRPLVWVACPAAADAARALAARDGAGLVYQRTDRYERFPGVNEAWIGACDRSLKRDADLTLFCSSRLFRTESAACRRAAHVDHGVDVSRFDAAGRGRTTEPADVRDLPRPRAGFIGGIDSHTFDPELFASVARALPDVSFVLVGGCSLPDGWCAAPNVSMLGQRPLEEVAGYMASCDVLIMPWRRGPWIDACNPVKLKEYLATGRPIVSTPFAELRHYRGLVQVASDAEAFARAIRLSLETPGDAEARRARVRGQSWRSKFEAVQSALRTGGVNLAPMPAAGLARRPRPPMPLGPPRGARGSSSIPAASPPETGSGAVRACIILCGGLVPSPLERATGRSVLDLPVSPDETILDRWVRWFEGVGAGQSTRPRIRVIHGASSPVPWPGRRRGAVQIEQEPRAFRGPAGVLRDICAWYGPEDRVLVVEGGRLLRCGLESLVAAHEEYGAEVTVASNPDGGPAGAYVIRCGALGEVSPAGYVDLKEQWLNGLVAQGRLVRVHRLEAPGSAPLRGPGQFLAAIGAEAPASDASWRVICDGAVIGRGATVTQSVVMPGARVGAGAVVARSILCPGSVVQPWTDIADAVVSDSRGLSDRDRHRVAGMRRDHGIVAAVRAARAGGGG